MLASGNSVEPKFFMTFGMMLTSGEWWLVWFYRERILEALRGCLSCGKCFSLGNLTGLFGSMVWQRLWAEAGLFVFTVFGAIGCVVLIILHEKRQSRNFHSLLGFIEMVIKHCSEVQLPNRRTTKFLNHRLWFSQEPFFKALVSDLVEALRLDLFILLLKSTTNLEDQETNSSGLYPLTSETWLCSVWG